MEALDVELESLQAEAFHQQSTVFEDEIQMRFTEEKLMAKTIEVDALNEKYKAVLNAHTKCKQQES